MAHVSNKPHFSVIITVTILILVSLTLPVSAEQCESKYEGGCHDKAKALKLKVIAIFCILVASMIGICLPIFSRAVPALQPDRDLFVSVKAFASGVILATGYMHVMPDSFDDLRSECLPEKPWRKFPFTTFVAMLAAVFTLMVDSFSIGYFKNKLSPSSSKGSLEGGDDQHGTGDVKSVNVSAEQLLKHRVVAQVRFFFFKTNLMVVLLI